MSLEETPLGSADKFDEVLAQLTELLARRALSWRVARSSVSASIEDDAAEDVVGDAARPDFDRVLSTTVQPVLTRYCLGDGVTPPLEFFAGQAIEGKLSDEDRQEISRRRNAILSALATDALLQRGRLRQTSKALTLDQVRWEISRKCHDLDLGRMEGLTYATLEFVLRGDRRPDPTWWGGLFPFGDSDTQKAVFDLHAEDLDLLIAELQTLQANLRSISEEDADG